MIRHDGIGTLYFGPNGHLCVEWSDGVRWDIGRHTSVRAALELKTPASRGRCILQDAIRGLAMERCAGPEPDERTP